MEPSKGNPTGLPTVISQEQQIEAPQKQFVLPARFVGKFKKLAAMPSVLNCERWQCQNDAPTTIVEFIDGSDGQELLLLGDGQTTIANNTKIKTNTGSSKLLIADKVYSFALFNGVWYEHA